MSKYKVCDVISVSSSFLIFCSLVLLFNLYYNCLANGSLFIYCASSCSNVNFAFRGVCNRCESARPAGASGGGARAGGRGRGRTGNDSGGPGRQIGAATGLFGPNDWSCPM